MKNFETTFAAKGGTHIPVAISGSIIYDEHGNEIGSIGFAKDLREIRRHDQLVTLGEIAVSLAHEINNPLEVIANTMQLLEDFVRRSATDEQMVIESERFEAVERELAKIQRIVSRVQEVAAGDIYETRQYLPGTLMTDLRGSALDDAARPHPVGGAVTATQQRQPLVAAAADPRRPRHPGRRRRPRRLPVARRALAPRRQRRRRSRPRPPRRWRRSRPARFDLVVSDVVMPDMDGYDLYMELKERRPELPVILMTGYLYDRDHVIKRSKLAGLDTRVLFKKPLDPDRLKQIILDRCARREDAGGERRDR